MKELTPLIDKAPTAFLTLTELPADAALLYATRIVKAGVIAKHWGKNRSLLYYTIDHKDGLGNRYTLSSADCQAVQLILNDLGCALRSVSLREGEQHQDLSPLFYGQTWADKFRVLGKVFHLSYLLESGLGKPASWRENRLSNRKSKKALGFNEEDLTAMRTLFAQVADWLSNLRIIPQTADEL